MLWRSMLSYLWGFWYPLQLWSIKLFCWLHFHPNIYFLPLSFIFDFCFRFINKFMYWLTKIMVVNELKFIFNLFCMEISKCLSYIYFSQACASIMQLTILFQNFGTRSMTKKHNNRSLMEYLMVSLLFSAQNWHISYFFSFLFMMIFTIYVYIFQIKFVISVAGMDVFKVIANCIFWIATPRSSSCLLGMTSRLTGMVLAPNSRYELIMGTIKRDVHLLQLGQILLLFFFLVSFSFLYQPSRYAINIHLYLKINWQEGR